MIEQQYLDDALRQLTKLRTQAERALAQISEEEMRRPLDPDSNSIALIMKHLAGNMRSRWTGFLTSDGEKPDRNRDGEFELSTADSRELIVAAWNEGWSCALNAVSSLRPEDLQTTVLIRGEPHTVVEAINRQVIHYAAHVGQIVLLAKHYAGPRWQSLSIPRGKSKEFDVSKSGAPYGVKDTRN